MMTEGNPDLARLTAGRVGLVCRTKVELYYFLAMEGTLSLLSTGPNASEVSP